MTLTRQTIFVSTLLLASLAGVMWNCRIQPNRQSSALTECQSALAVNAVSPAKQPYAALNGGTFSGPSVKESPDPLIAYRWKETKADDSLQIYLLRPVRAYAEKADSFEGIGTATGPKPSIKVKGAGSLRFDFGVESAAWLEFDSPDLSGTVEMSISEYNEPAIVNSGPANPVKTAIPDKFGNTYRLRLNEELYEGVRFGWIHVRSFTREWHITGVRLVCQTKPANYEGSFSCSDSLLTRIWYTGAYTVKLNLMKDYFGAILMDRGDRISWTGDAHPSQAASMVAFGNYDFVRKNIDNTSGQDNGIRSYSLYWVLSLVDYYRYTGDTSTLRTYLDNACRKLDDAFHVYGTHPRLGFYGWDERLGAGFENSSCTENQFAYGMLSIRAWKEFSEAMRTFGRTDLSEKYSGYANDKLTALRRDAGWYQPFGFHACADAVTTGLLKETEKEEIFRLHFTDRVNRISFSPFNQYFVIQAFAMMNKHDDALNSIRDLWGGQVSFGGTTFFEDYRPFWNLVLGANDPVPNNQCGYTSMCHPWGGGVTKWLTEEILGIKPASPGFRTFDLMPHLGRTLMQVSGSVPTPYGTIKAGFDIKTGECTVDVPEGTTGRIGIPKVEKSIVKILVNGRPVWDGAYQPVPGIGGADQDSEFVYFNELKAGSYSFTVTYNGVTPPFHEPPVTFPATFLGEDTVSHGDWGGRYGKDGYVLFNHYGNGKDKASLPPYVSSVNSYMKSSNGKPGYRAGPAGLYSGDPEACQQSFLVTIQVKGQQKYQVALYFADYDDKGRRQAVDLFDESSLRLVAPTKIVRDFRGGKYLIYSYDRSARFRIYQVRGENAVLNGIFFDPGNGS